MFFMIRTFFLLSLLFGGLSSAASPVLRSFGQAQQAMNMTNYVWNGESLLLSNQIHSIRFFPGRKRTEIDGVTFWLNQVPEGNPDQNSWKMAAADLDLLSLSIFPTHEKTTSQNLFVLLDAGHGGSDAGAISPTTHVLEKDFTLLIAKQLGAALTNAGFRVAFTRTNDVPLSLARRISLVRKIKPDLFLSLHANHAPNPDACGFETYTLQSAGFQGTAPGTRKNRWSAGNKHDFENALLGFSIQREVVRAKAASQDRGLRHQAFYLLRESPVPAALLEFGFLSHATESEKMSQHTWQTNHTHAIVKALSSYAKRIAPLKEAVAIKREKDRAANLAWRMKLKARAAEAKKELIAAIRPSRVTAQTSPAPQPLAAPFPLAPFPDPESAESESQDVKSDSIAKKTTVNPPADEPNLLDFYIKNSSQE